MTIVIAMMASDGIVMAADREEGDSYLKNDQGKIGFTFRAMEPLGTCAVAGAGPGVHLDEISDQLRTVFTDDENGSASVVGPKLRDAHRAYYKEAVLPLSKERPHYSLLIGCFGQSIKAIWRTSGLAFNKVGDYDAVGYGDKVAKIWLNKLYDRVPVLCAAKLAAYVVLQTKLSVKDVGGGTDILVIKRDGFPGYVPSDVIREWENVFRSYATLERNSFYYCLGLEMKEELLFRTKLGKDQLAKSLDEFREALTRLDGQKLEDSQ